MTGEKQPLAWSVLSALHNLSGLVPDFFCITISSIDNSRLYADQWRGFGQRFAKRLPIFIEPSVLDEGCRICIKDSLRLAFIREVRTVGHALMISS